MTIQNSLGVAGFSRRLTRGFAGQPQGDVRARPFRNALLAQINTVTIAGFGADTDSVTLSITLPDGTVVQETTTRAAGVPVDDAAAVTALKDLVNARAALRGHVVAEDDADVLTLTFQHTNIEYTVETTVTGCTATVAETQAPGGSSIPIGRFVKRGTSVGHAPAVDTLDSTDDDTVLAGILLRSVAQYPNAESPLASANDVVPAGNMCDVAFEGEVLMLNTGDVAASAGGQVFVVVATTGGDEVGEARADADGVVQVTTLTPGAGQNSVEVSVLVTITSGEHEGKSLLLSALADASMTATEVCDAWRTQLNADAFWSALLVDTGTATLILTAADASFSFDVTAVQGTTTIAATTAHVAYAIPVDRRKAYWVEDTAAGAIGPIMLRM